MYGDKLLIVINNNKIISNPIFILNNGMGFVNKKPSSHF